MNKLKPMTICIPADVNIELALVASVLALLLHRMAATIEIMP